MKTWQTVSMMMCLAATGRAEAKPAWCTEKLAHGDGDGASSDNPKKLVEATIDLECADSPRAGVDVDALYKKTSARLGMTDADWSDAAEWAVSDPDKDLKAADKLAWTKMGPVMQFGGVKFTAISMSGMYGTVDPSYFIDALGPRLTETGRAAYIRTCLDSDSPVMWAMCQPDIDAFDAKKALAELRTDKDSEAWQRMQVRFAIADLAPRLKKHAADVSALLAKDPVYKQMFDIATHERAAWDARYKTKDLALDVAAEMEDALVTQSRKAAEGCRAKTWNAVKAAISKIPAASFAAHRLESDKFDEQFHDRIQSTLASTLLGDDGAYPAVSAAAMCMQLQDDPKAKDPVVALVAPTGWRVQGARGPRTATASQLFFANLKPDDRSVRIEFPAVKRDWFHVVGSLGQTKRGVISAVKPAGDKVTIEFTKAKHDELVVFGCHDTNHIRTIHSDGSVVYDEVCTGSKMKTFLVGPPPATVDKDNATGAKPGVMALAEATTVLEVWPNGKTDTPSFVLGQPVK